MAAFVVNASSQVGAPSRLTFATAQGAFVPQQFGAVGDGTTDDSAAIESCVAAWLADVTSTLLVPPARYRITRQIDIAPPSGVLSSRIEGYGATLVMDGAADYGLSIWQTNGATSHLAIDGLGFDGCGLRLGADQGDSMYGLTLRDLTIRDFDEHGIVLLGAFECQIHGPRISTSQLVGHGIHLVPSGTTFPSSVDIFGGAMRGGLHGLYSNAADVKLFGGTYLQSGEEGIYLDNDAHGSTISGVHVENTWVSAASQAAAGGGIYAEGPVLIEGCYGTQDGTGKQAFVAKVKPTTSAPSIVLGGRCDNMLQFVSVDGAVGTTALLIGVQDYEDAGHEGTTTVV